MAERKNERSNGRREPGREPGRGRASAGASAPAQVIANRNVRRTATPEHARERILAYGKEGSGKSYDWLTIAEAYPNVPFFVVDTDDSVQRLLEEEFSNLRNIHVEVAQTWEEFDEACDKHLAAIEDWVLENPVKRREDYPWLVVDFCDTTWSMVQNYFTEQVFDRGIAEYFLLARRKMRESKKGQLDTFEGWTDWQVINKLFQTRWNALTKRGGSFHLYITAQTTNVSGDRETRSMYQSLKTMPSGEKRMGHRVHTVLFCTADKEGYFISAAKDRGRVKVDDLQVTDFVTNYLVNVAGWEV